MSTSTTEDVYGLAEIPEEAPVALNLGASRAADQPAAGAETAATNGATADPSPPKAAKAKKSKKAASKSKGGGALAGKVKGLLGRFKSPRKSDLPATEGEKNEAAATAAGSDNATKPGGDPKSAAAKSRKKKRRGSRWVLPAWALSVLVHVVVLGSLGAMTLSSEVRTKIMNLNTSMFKDTGGSADELTKIYADQSKASRDEAVGQAADAAGTSGGETGGAAPNAGLALAGGGLGGPSATPRVGAVGKVGARVGGAGAGDGNGLPGGLKVIAQVSGLSILPAAPNRDLGGGGGIAGDVTFATGEIGEALDQLAREILRNLSDHRITVVWLFDESESMKDDQKAVKSKFDRVSLALKEHVDAERKSANALTHVVLGFGKDLHFMLEKPTADVSKIGAAIDHLRVDTSGTENVLQAVGTVVRHYGSLITKNRRLLIVLVTDESGDDGSNIEEARQLAVSQKVPIYVIGRQSLFGYSAAHLQYVDPVTKDVYWPTIRRGPETADVELLQWDGLHDRWDEQPSGFAPYELARLAKDTGGIYFLLPSEEFMRVRQREKAYSMTTLKEYVPDYESRSAYNERRTKSQFRRELYQIIQETRPDGKNPMFQVRRHFPVDLEKMIVAANEEGPKSNLRVQALVAIEKRLRALQKMRDREPEKRWQADYDLMLAQIVTYQIKSFEYGACLAEMVKTRPLPKTMPTKDLIVEWVLDHSKDRKAPAEKTQKQYVEAERLLKLVIERHPKTPWADLAQDELNRGFGVQRNEWHHNPKYDERAKLVPKY
jgi:hypothetical protein